MEQKVSDTHENPESIGAGGNKHTSGESEDEAVVVEGGKDGTESLRDERRPKASRGFRIALLKELQNQRGNPFMGRKRGSKESWDNLAQRLKSVKEVTCEGKFRKRTFLVTRQETYDGSFCSRLFTRLRTNRKKQDRIDAQAPGEGTRVSEDSDRGAEELELDKALLAVNEFEALGSSNSETAARIRQLEDASDVRSRQEEMTDTKDTSSKGKRKYHGETGDGDILTSDPLGDDVDYVDVSGKTREESESRHDVGSNRERTENDVSQERRVAFPGGNQASSLERLTEALANVGEKIRSGQDRSSNDASILDQFSKIDDRIEKGFSRLEDNIIRVHQYLSTISRDQKIIEDELVRMRRDMSSLEYEVKRLGQENVSGPPRALALTSVQESNGGILPLRSTSVRSNQEVGRCPAPCARKSDRALQ